jgi:replicative DNA helicase
VSDATNIEERLPAALDAERTILGAVLLDNDAWDQIPQQLKPDDFSLDSHKRIVVRMKKLRERGQSIDIVTLSHELAGRNEIETVGGVAYLASLTEGLPIRPVIEDYIRIVKGKSVLRKLMLLSTAAIARAAEQTDSPLEIAGDLQRQIEEITAPIADANKAPVKSFIAETRADINAEYRDRVTRCIPSGNPWFDAKTGGGYRQGKITLVCARPNVGKTPWGVSSVAHNCKLGRKVVVFSLEMEKHEILRNLVPFVVDVPNIAVNKATIQTPEQNRLINYALDETLIDWPLSIYDGDMDMDQICFVIDRETRGGEDVLFVLDHFGLISGGDRRDTRARYNENSARLRRKMKHKNAALVALCQLRKVSREFADKPPIADDIKESGNMYEDAFACLIIHRAIEKDTMRMSRETLLNLAKLRSGGSTGTTTGHFNTRVLCFEADPEPEQDDDSNYFSG